MLQKILEKMKKNLLIITNSYPIWMASFWNKNVYSSYCGHRFYFYILFWIILFYLPRIFAKNAGRPPYQSIGISPKSYQSHIDTPHVIWMICWPITNSSVFSFIWLQTETIQYVISSIIFHKHKGTKKCILLKKSYFFCRKYIHYYNGPFALPSWIRPMYECVIIYVWYKHTYT